MCYNAFLECNEWYYVHPFRIALNNNEYIQKFEMIFTFQFLISFTFVLQCTQFERMHCHNRTIFFSASFTPTHSFHCILCNLDAYPSFSLSFTIDWLRLVVNWCEMQKEISLVNKRHSFNLMALHSFGSVANTPLNAIFWNREMWMPRRIK